MCRDEVIGFSKEKDFFKKIIANNKLHHGYIFSGISGIGKKKFAIELARSLFCERGSFFSPCECLCCLQVKNNVFPDLYIYTGSELTKENIDKISKATVTTALVSKWKVFILDCAEILSNSNHIVAGNAVLKTLEEPGENTLFLLITSKYDAIMPTIRSRCINVKFPAHTDSAMKEIIHRIRPNMDYIDSIIKASGGSVEKAFLIDDLKIYDIINNVKNKNFLAFAQYISSCTDIVVIQSIMENLYILALEQYKHTNNYFYSQFGDYIVEVLSRLKFNINIDLMKNDLITKTVEVFSERM